VEVTHLTSAGNGALDARRMPSTDTSDLAETTVSLAGKLTGAPALGDTGVTVTLGDTNDVNHLVLVEDVVDGDELLEETNGKVDLGSRASTAVHLDLHEVSLLLAKVELADLGVGKDADDGGVLLELGELLVNGLGLVSPLLGVLGESLALRAVPVLVEAATNIIGQVRCPDGGEGAETARGLDVAHNADSDHGRSLEDGDLLEDLLLVLLRADLVQIAHNVSATGLVAEEGSEVRGGFFVIQRERFHFAAETGATLAG